MKTLLIVSLISRIRSPKPTKPKVVNKLESNISANENLETANTNEHSEGNLTETEDIEVETSTNARRGYNLPWVITGILFQRDHVTKNYSRIVQLTLIC